MNKINIAIDGYSSCGKSTLAKALAKALHYHYVDTGSMYRAIALYAMRKGMIGDNKEIDTEALEASLPEMDVEFRTNPATRYSEVFLDNEPVETYIRTIEVAEMASRISKLRSVRSKLHSIQRLMASRKGVIMDGRDIGTVVMPDAELKIFMTADPEVRAQRRFQELTGQGKNVTLEEVRKNQAERDHEDTHRQEDPLRRADDAIVLDNTFLDEKQQLEMMLEKVRQRILAR